MDNSTEICLYSGKGWQGNGKPLDMGKKIKCWKGKSGKPGKRDWTKINDAGPTPPGWYRLGPELETGKGEREEAMNDGDGTAFKRKFPPIPDRGNPPHKRQGIRLHPDGDDDGTLGCIGICCEDSAEFYKTVTDPNIEILVVYKVEPKLPKKKGGDPSKRR